VAGLYLHIPFCEHKCIYCDFYSIAPNGERAGFDALIRRFLDALGREITLRTAAPFTDEQFDTVFFGGGTPSLLAPSDVSAIVERLRSSFRITPDAEVTLEANPGTVDRTRLAEFRTAGINRLSIGIQSFHADDLAFLTRIHSADQARACVRDAFDAGFHNVSVDLIFALPGQTEERWRSNLEEALALGPTHLSCYSLIVEPNTPLFRMVETHQVAPLGTEQDAAQYEQTMDILTRNGFEQYEVSNFARPGFRSRHNIGYWNHSNYLGFGPSAHSFWIDKRWWNTAQLQTYLDRLANDRLPSAGEERLTTAQMMEEAIFLGLRSDGIDIPSFEGRFGMDLRARYGRTIEGICEQHLAEIRGGRLTLTPRGYAVCDEICQLFR
jgi:oxygen-independent coproporphyrinogen-3 oxidase